jgi:fructose-specific phosphotransferase system IIC component
MKTKIFLSLVALAFTSVAYSQTLVEVNEYSRNKTKVSSTNTFTGYFNITDVGVLIGSSDNSRVAPFSFMTINGMHMTEQLSLGLGVGLEFPSGSYMPLVLDTRYYLRNESFSPFFSLYGGFALPLDDNGY